MRFPKPRRVELHNGTVRYLVRTPEAMGGGREYCHTKADAEKRIKELRDSANSATKEFAALHSSDQAIVLGLIAQFDGDVRKLKAAADLGAGRLPTMKLVKEAVAAFLQDHKPGALRKASVTHLLNRFALSFGEKRLDDVETAHLERWLNSHDWGPKMFNECRQMLSQFWKYCIRWKWIVTNPVTDIPVKKVPRHMVQIYSPEELSKMLANLAKRRPLFVPAIAIGAFTGLRISEVARLTWEQVNAALRTGHFELEAYQAGKTLEARVVPLLPNLRKWLEAHKQPSGLVLPEVWKKKKAKLGELGKFIQRLSSVPWKSNALRHSFGTYRFKIVNDVGQVVDEMGTSIRNFEKHYRKRSQLVTPALAKAYFAIRP